MSGYVQTIVTGNNGIIFCNVTKHAKILDAEIEARDMVSSLFESGMRFGGSFGSIRNVLVVMENYQIGISITGKKPRYHKNFIVNVLGNIAEL